jgi:hypothetical protein
VAEDAGRARFIDKKESTLSQDSRRTRTRLDRRRRQCAGAGRAIGVSGDTHTSIMVQKLTQRISAQIAARAHRSAPARAAATRISSAWSRISAGIGRVRLASCSATDLVSAPPSGSPASSTW